MQSTCNHITDLQSIGNTEILTFGCRRKSAWHKEHKLHTYRAEAGIEYGAPWENILSRTRLCLFHLELERFEMYRGIALSKSQCKPYNCITTLYGWYYKKDSRWAEICSVRTDCNAAPTKKREGNFYYLWKLNKPYLGYTLSTALKSLETIKSNTSGGVDRGGELDINVVHILQRTQCQNHSYFLNKKIFNYMIKKKMWPCQFFS